jgi:hypothetical protein
MRALPHRIVDAKRVPAGGLNSMLCLIKSADFASNGAGFVLGRKGMEARSIRNEGVREGDTVCFDHGVSQCRAQSQCTRFSLFK